MNIGGTLCRPSNRCRALNTLLVRLRRGKIPKQRTVTRGRKVWDNLEKNTKAKFLSEFEQLYARWLSTPRLNVRPRLKLLSNNLTLTSAEDIFAVWTVYRRNRKDTCRNPKLGSLTARYARNNNNNVIL